MFSPGQVHLNDDVYLYTEFYAPTGEVRYSLKADGKHHRLTKEFMEEARDWLHNALMIERLKR